MTREGHDRGRLTAEALLMRIAGTRTRILATGFVTFWAVFVVHWLCAIYGPRQLPYWVLQLFDWAISGAVAGGLASAVLWLASERQTAMSRHAWEVLQLNHHIRNAMQVIAYSQNGLPREQVSTVMDALNRIGHALCAISNPSAAKTNPEETGCGPRDMTKR